MFESVVVFGITAAVLQSQHVATRKQFFDVDVYGRRLPDVSHYVGATVLHNHEVAAHDCDLSVCFVKFNPVFLFCNTMELDVRKFLSDKTKSHPHATALAPRYSSRCCKGAVILFSANCRQCNSK